MSDLISRQDAIDAINHISPVDTEYDCALLDRVDVRYVLSDLQSAEPERTLESAIDYLHSVGWLQEHDRILTESAEPERRWIPFTMRELTTEEKEEHPEWDSILDCKLPDNGEEILVSNGKYVWLDTFISDCDGCYLDGGDDVESLAWMPLPEPWRGE